MSGGDEPVSTQYLFRNDLISKRSVKADFPHYIYPITFAAK